MSERTEQLGRRAEYEQERSRLQHEVEALRDSLRRQLPLDADAGELDADKILNFALSLNQSLEELKEVDKRLRIIRQNLGG